MEIFYILPKDDYFSKGYRGRVTHAIGVANGLAENNHQVSVFSDKGIQNFNKDFHKNINLINPIVNIRFPLLKRFLWSYRLLFLIIKKRKSVNPKLIICRYAVSNVVFNQVLFYLNRRSKFLFEINSLAYHQLFRLHPFIRKIILWFEIKQLNKYSLLYVVSQHIKDDLINNNCNCSVIVIPNAFGGFNPKLKNESNNKNTIRLIYFGKFQWYYDFNLLIDAYNDLRFIHDNMELHFWGDGLLKNKTLNKAKFSEKIYFYGEYKREELINLFHKKSDILILPLKSSEQGEIGSSIKLFEYMSFGLPIVTSRIGQAKEIIIHTVNGYHYHPDSIGSLSSILNFCINNEDQRIIVGERARYDLYKNHTWNIRMKNMIDMIVELNQK